MTSYMCVAYLKGFVLERASPFQMGRAAQGVEEYALSPMRFSVV